jgi:hypothetical protein
MEGNRDMEVRTGKLRRIARMHESEKEVYIVELEQRIEVLENRLNSMEQELMQRGSLSVPPHLYPKDFHCHAGVEGWDARDLTGTGEPYDGSRWSGLSETGTLQVRRKEG